jgi:isopenicillin-N N-acyltransferase-like protein
LDLSGTPHQRGLQHGRGAAELVARSIEIYRKAFKSKGVSWERAREVATALLPVIAAYDQGFADEIRGIAEGAKVPLEDVVALNARTELLYGQHPQAPKGPDTDGDGCTGAIALPGATRDGIVIHGQNWDWRDECADSCLLLRIRSEDGPDILCFTEGGLPGADEPDPLCHVVLPLKPNASKPERAALVIGKAVPHRAHHIRQSPS